MNIKIQVNGYSVCPKRFIGGTRGSYGFSEMEFSFDDEWNGLVKRVSFYPPTSNAVSVILTENTVQIPSEVMACKGVSKFTLTGSKDGKMLISVTGEIDVLDTNTPAESEAQKPTESQMEQALALMQTAVQTAESVRDDADDGVFDGATGEKGEKGEKGDKGDTGASGRGISALSGGDDSIGVTYTDGTVSEISLEGCIGGSALVAGAVSEDKLDIGVKQTVESKQTAALCEEKANYDTASGRYKVCINAQEGTKATVFIPTSSGDVCDVRVRGQNLLEKVFYENGSMTVNTSGDVTLVQYYESMPRVRSEYIPVCEGKTYHFDTSVTDTDGRSISILRIYFFAAKVKRSISNTYCEGTSFDLTVPQGAKYIKLLFIPSEGLSIDVNCIYKYAPVMRRTDLDSEQTVTAQSEKFIVCRAAVGKHTEISTSLPNMYVMYIPNSQDKGLTISCVGASLTYMAKNRVNYPEYLSDILNCKVNNCGISGRTMARGTNALLGSDIYSMVTGNFPENCQRSVPYDFSSSDVIIIQCVSSDALDSAITLSDVDTDGEPLYDNPLDSTQPTSYYGALNGIAEKLITSYAGKMVVFVSFIDNIPPTDTNYTKRMQYYEATKAVAQKYNIPYLDLMHGFIINGRAAEALYNAGYLQLEADGISHKHLTERGSLAYAERVAGFIRLLKGI